MASKNHKVHIEAVVDRSGSMGAIVNDAIGGYNTWLQAQKAAPGKASLTLNLFDNEHKITQYNDVREAPELTLDTYVPRASTALNDAIGQALARLNERNPKRAILAILTDGMENASVEYRDTAKIKDMIKAAEAKGWQVVYLSSDVNAFAHARAYGVSASNTMQYSHDAAGTRAAFTTLSAVNTAYRAGDVKATLASVNVNDGEVEQSGSSSGS